MTWFETKRGSDLLLLEQKILDQLFDHLFGYNIVQIGNHRSLIENSRFKNKYSCKQIQFDAEQLPFESNAIDCIVLPHQNTEDERMLSEVYRSLMPHGHAIFINFNPWSPIGLRTFFSMSSEEPWNHNLESFTSFQNKLLKQYCDEKDKFFALPQGEIVFSKNYIQLRSLIDKLKKMKVL